MKIKVLVFPRDRNPYQTLLYSHFQSKTIITYLTNPTKSHVVGVLLLPFQLILFRMKGYNIFHLHWVYSFQFTVKNKLFYTFPFKLFFTFYFLLFLYTIKTLRYKLVWTVHDLVPHGKQFINDLFISKQIATLSDQIIVHSEATIQNLERLHIPHANTIKISIGNYIEIYPNTSSEQQAKKFLNIPDSEFIYGFFGRIESYKGVIELINSFKQLKHANDKLLISGPCQDAELRKEIESLSEADPRIRLHIGFIPVDQVQYYLNAVDIFVYPFQKITTSSSVILAMSFGKPVICPKLGELLDLPDDTGYYYLPGKTSDLTGYMQRAYERKKERQEKAKQAKAYAMSLDWNVISDSTNNLYNSLLEN